MNKRINKSNYEEFFIDYLDGRLSVEEIVMMEDFLLQYPELREELEGLENIKLGHHNIKFEPKDDLKQIDLDVPVTDENFDFFCVAEAEGDLNEEQQAALKAYITGHPEKNRDLLMYMRLKIEGDQNVKYPDKSSLKKSLFLTYRREIYGVAALAAGIALLIAVFIIIPGSNLPSSEFSMVDEQENFSTDSTSVIDKQEREINNDQDSEKKEIDAEYPQSQKNKTKLKARSDIRFKVTIPIAEVNDEGKKENDLKSDKEILADLKINMDEFNRSLNHFQNTFVANDNKAINTLYQNNSGRSSDSSDYLSLEEFAKQKFTNVVSGAVKESREISLWSVASSGINTLNDLVGSNVKLERKVDEEGKTRRISFDAGVFAISTPVNKSK